MIEVINLSKRFGAIEAVKKVNFKVAKGEVLGFLGPNGAGKSTTIRMIAGFIPPNEGEILIAGKKFIEDPIAAKARIGYMPESNPLFKDMTAGEYLGFIAEVHGVKDIEKRVNEILELANLKEVKCQLIDTLSKGYRSRLSFASSVIHDPEILLLDEPTDGLDPNQKNEIRNLIKKLSRDKAIVVSTHILEEVEAMCTRVVIISEGKIILDGPPAELRKHALNNNKIMVTISKSDKERAEGSIGSRLHSFGAFDSNSEKYLVEDQMTLDQVRDKLNSTKINFKEIYSYLPPLDEAFRKITRTKE